MKYFTGLVLSLLLGFVIPVTAEAGQSCATHDATDIKQRASKYRNIIKTYSKKYDVDSRLITAIITTESCFKNKARSYKGAAGLMQLMPRTAKRWGIRNRHNADQNIRCGTRYIAHLLKRFNGNVKLAIAAYNAGEGNVDKYHGIPPFRSTRNYVKNVLLVYSKLGGRKLRVKIPAFKQKSKKRRKGLQKRSHLQLDFKFDNPIIKQLLNS